MTTYRWQYSFGEPSSAEEMGDLEVEAPVSATLAAEIVAREAGIDTEVDVYLVAPDGTRHVVLVEYECRPVWLAKESRAWT